MILFEHPNEEIETVCVPVADDKSPRKLKMESFPILYPHRVLTYLFNEVGIEIPPQDVAEYWQHSREMGEPWAIHSPASSQHIPLGLHGDGARLFTQYKFEKQIGVAFNLPLFKPRSVRHSRFVLFTIPNAKLYKNRTMNQVFRVLTWSFNAAFQGLNPSTGPMGGALCGEALRRAGTPLTAGFHKFCLCELRGDWEWHVCIWRPTSSWVSKNVCFKCGALSSGTPEMLYHNTGAPGEVRCRWIEEEYTHDQFIARGLKDTNLCNLTRMG